MKLKAQNVIEVVSLVAVVGVLVVVVFMSTKGSVEGSSKLSKIDGLGTNQAVAVKPLGSGSDSVTHVTATETAGSSAYGLSDNTLLVFENALNSSTIEDIKQITNLEMDDLIGFANNVIVVENLDMNKITESELNEAAKQSLINVAVKGAEKEQPSDLYYAYVGTLSQVAINKGFETALKESLVAAESNDVNSVIENVINNNKNLSNALNNENIEELIKNSANADNTASVDEDSWFYKYIYEPIFKPVGEALINVINSINSFFANLF